MHCPVCSHTLDMTAKGNFACVVGNVGMSMKLTRELREVYELELRPPRPNAFRDQSRGPWFCPKCGVLLEKTSSEEYRCPTCERTIGEFIYQLIERYPHSGELRADIQRPLK